MLFLTDFLSQDSRVHRSALIYNLPYNQYDPTTRHKCTLTPEPFPSLPFNP